MARHNFSMPVKRELASRAAYFCSNPSCRKLTSGPRSGSERGLETGHAAHIRAASGKGPRFDPLQSEAERSAIQNGIWLCRECGDLVDEDEAGYSSSLLLTWKSNHEALIAEVRLKGYSQSLDLLRSTQAQSNLAREIIALIEDRRVFWARFDAEFPDRVRLSLGELRSNLLKLRSNCAADSPIDVAIVALASTVRRFFDSLEKFDLKTLLCNFNNPDWRAFELALLALRKSIFYQVAALSDAYQIPLSGEFAAHVPHYLVADGKPDQAEAE